LSSPSLKTASVLIGFEAKDDLVRLRDGASTAITGRIASQVLRNPVSAARTNLFGGRMTIMNAETAISGKKGVSGGKSAAAGLIAKGDLARDLRDWTTARLHYEEALRIEPSHGPIWIQLGHAAKELGDHAAAGAAYRKAVEVNPRDADAHLQLGHLMKVGGHLSAAIEAYGQAVAIDPNLSEAQNEIGILERRLLAQDHRAKGDSARDARDWDSARTQYEEALRLDPTLHPAWIQLGHASKELGEYAKAEAAYRKALQLKPDDADEHLQLGHLLKAMGRTSAAIEALSKVHAVRPDLPDVQKELESLRQKLLAEQLRARGDMARDAHNWEAAREHYQHALRADPGLEPIWIQLGHAAKEVGDNRGAEEAYRKAVQLKPDDADAYLQLGHLMKIMGKLSAATECYSQAVALDPRLADAHSEIEALRKRTVKSGRRGAEIMPYSAARHQKRSAAGTLFVVFEVSDLMAYFQNSRLPTGIQRVQMEVIKAIGEAEPVGVAYSIVCFAQDRGCWVEIPTSLFEHFCHSAVGGGDPASDEWKQLLVALEHLQSGGPAFRFPQGSILLDLGTSWWQRNYFLNLRLAQSISQIRYVPFIHDLIPIVTPEYCAVDLRRDFISWIAGVFHHTKYFFANSRATKADLEAVAAKLDAEVGEVAVVPLNADFRHSVEALSSELPPEDPAYFLQMHELKKRNYVLCVATVEARKNHAAAFAVWLRLIKKYGVRNVPKLVCVGKDGWLNDHVYHMLRASEILSSQVVMLQNVSDPALAALYKNCLCTLYPTFYEGWGLPVTEALCYGKIPVTAKVSSLPEAGGDFAEYFDIGSENELFAKIERLMTDPEYRRAREKKIAAELRPRPWRHIADQIIAQLRSWSAEDDDSARDSAEQVPTASAGVLHSLGRGTDAILWRGFKSGEVYRSGSAWWPTEDWGCWTRGHRTATISFLLKDVAQSGLLIYVGLRGLPGKECICSLRCEGARALQTELRSEQDHVAVLELEPTAEADRQITISTGSDFAVDLSLLTENADSRVVGPGVRWFYACKKDDVLARVGMAEALATGDYRRLTPQAPVRPDFFVHT
jgi:tetratricopeptide (TPR) repeat protein/glycosyltransferase involved in cell wall biosynthesis